VSHVRVHKVLVVLTIVALLLGSATAADAKKKRKKKKNTVPTTVVVESARGTFINGTVESSKSGCVDERKVSITRNGDPVTSADTDSEGQWFTRTGGTIQNGDVIVASVDKVVVKSKKKSITCGSDSDRYVVGNQSSNNNGNPNAGGTETLTVNVSGNGTVNSNPAGINSCRATTGTCVADFPTGSTVNLTATPDSDSTFQGWTGACGGSAQPCQVVMSTDKTVGAVFQSSGTPAPACGIPDTVPAAIRDVLCAVIALIGG